ncbi:MAG: polyprenyl synthetase family protein, partial [Candidatus Dormibacteraceae bacterium]
VEDELRRQLTEDAEAVGGPMRRLVEAGGKRLRPVLVGLCSTLGPRHQADRAAVLGAAVELIHDATLVHDDYVDEATVRRGRPAVAALEGPRRAIAVGDYYFAKATRLIADLGNPAVTRVIAAAMETICLAQIDDVTMRGSFPGDPVSYRQVVRGKTAALFSAACESGALLGGAVPSVASHLANYGELVGIAFQMEDDLLDYADHTGKPKGTDIRQRTVSLPLIYASEDAASGPQVRALLEGPLDDPTVERVQELVRRSGALARVEQEAAALVEAALVELRQVEMNGVAPRLVGVAEGAIGRIR